MPHNGADKENGADKVPSQRVKNPSVDKKKGGTKSKIKRDPNLGDRPDNKAENTSKDTVYGKHHTMPVLMTDIFQNVDLPVLEEFDPSDIKLDATIVAVGKRRTGKTWVFRNIMYLMKDKFQAGIVISQTDELNHFWRDYVPEKYIYKKYDPAILEAVFRRQKRIINDPALTDEEKEKEAPFFILLDDVISDQRLKYDEALMELFVAGRHYKLFILITTQYAKAITPVLRGNTDYCFMMKCIQQRQLESLWEDFGSFLTKHAFALILEESTEDNECLVINTCPECTIDPLDMMKWWKAVDPGPFKMGSEEYWRSAIFNPVGNVPPAKTGESASYWLTVKDITPASWRPFFSGVRSY